MELEVVTMTETERREQNAWRVYRLALKGDDTEALESAERVWREAKERVDHERDDR
jgi:hypothetical protein